MSYHTPVGERDALAGFGCGADCRCRACRGWSGFAQAPAAPLHTREVRVVVKSFIRCIGLNAGSLPLRCSVMSPPGSEARLRALALATDAMMCEEPTHDRKDKRYRLFSGCTFRVTCQDGRVVEVTPSALDTDTGKEGPLQAPPLITSPVSVGRTSDGFTFSWFARGRPHLAAEPPFQLVCPRTSVYIWHRVSGRVRCTPEGTDVSVNLTGSKFPTHRVFVNGTAVRTVPQGGFARLWSPVSLSELTRVEGLSGREPFGSFALHESNGFKGVAPAPAPPPGPVFRFECPAGCPQGAEAQCRRVLYRAIADAITICINAAAELEANPRSTRTRNIFRSLFGHDPSRPVPWAGNQESGAIVAHRLRKVAEAFHGRVTHFRCGGFPGAPAGQQCAAGDNAFTIPGLHPNVIFLCPQFWNQEALVPATPPFPATAAGRARVARFWRAGIVLHEMLHLLYRGFFRHATVPPHPDDPQERRRDNAHCYEAFALQVTRHLPDPDDITACRNRPA